MGVANKMGLLVLGSRPHSSRNCARSAPNCNYLQFIMARSDGLKWKSAERRTWTFLAKWRYWFWDRTRPARIVARKAYQNSLIASLWLLEVIDCNENLHEGGHGLCQLNDVVGFGMARAECVILRKARKNALICSLLWLEVSDCNGNGYEGGRGRCRWNVIIAQQA